MTSETSHLSHRNTKITPLDDGTNRRLPSRSSSQFLPEQRDELPHRDPRMVGGSVCFLSRWRDHQWILASNMIFQYFSYDFMEKTRDALQKKTTT